MIISPEKWTDLESSKSLIWYSLTVYWLYLSRHSERSFILRAITSGSWKRAAKTLNPTVITDNSFGLSMDSIILLLYWLKWLCLKVFILISLSSIGFQLSSSLLIFSIKERIFNLASSFFYFVFFEFFRYMLCS